MSPTQEMALAQYLSVPLSLEPSLPSRSPIPLFPQISQGRALFSLTGAQHEEEEEEELRSSNLLNPQARYASPSLDGKLHQAIFAQIFFPEPEPAMGSLFCR